VSDGSQRDREPCTWVGPPGSFRAVRLLARADPDFYTGPLSHPFSAHPLSGAAFSLSPPRAWPARWWYLSPAKEPRPQCPVGASRTTQEPACTGAGRGSWRRAGAQSLRRLEPGGRRSRTLPTAPPRWRDVATAAQRDVSRLPLAPPTAAPGPEPAGGRACAAARGSVWRGGPWGQGSVRRGAFAFGGHSLIR